MALNKYTKPHRTSVLNYSHSIFINFVTCDITMLVLKSNIKIFLFPTDGDLPKNFVIDVLTFFSHVDELELGDKCGK